MLTRLSDYGWGGLDRTFAALDDFRRRVDRLLEDVDSGPEGKGAWGSGTGWPRAVLRDEGSALRLYAEVPGLAEKEIELNLDRNVLSISGHRAATIPEGYSVHRRERADVSFSRSFALPCPVDPEKAAATVKEGVLTVTLEKAVEAQPRRISVRAT